MNNDQENAEKNEKTVFQAGMFFNRLKKRYKHLKKWANRSGTNAFRLYDRDIPEIPLVIDLYKDALAGAFFERPFGESEKDEKNWLGAMIQAASQALDIPEDRVFLKIRKRQRGESQYERIDGQNFFVDIRENSLVFRANLSDYLDTGLFLDRRKLRALIQKSAENKTILNLFSYTSASSLCAAAGGALETDSVDMSNTYLDWAKVNFALNGLKADFVKPSDIFHQNGKNNLIRADALRFLDGAVKNSRKWDIIILDPPTFSNSKKMSADFDVNRDYKPLIAKSLFLLSKQGKLYFSTNARRFHFDADFFSVAPENITELIRDDDFTGKKIPSCWLFSKN
jgi:23S rRNA G2069 N7-methylase RlmK/C1962 C5-methylase RlmI